MKIGIDARFVGPEGTGLGKYTEKLILNLALLDSRNQYFIFLKDSNWDYLALKSKNFKKISANIPWYSVEEQLRMPKIYKSCNLDLVHIPHFNAPLFYNPPIFSLLGLHERSEFTGKFIVTIHDLIHHHFKEQSTTTRNQLLFKIKHFGYQIVIKNAIKRSEKIIVPSNFVKEEILSNFKVPADKIVVTYEAAEEEYFNQAPDIRHQVPVLVYVGNAYPHKNLNRLLDALKILTEQHPRGVLATLRGRSGQRSVQAHPGGEIGLKLIVVCPRDIFFKRLKEEITKRDLDQTVELKSYLKANELSKLFSESSAYIFPSLSEGFGIPGLNAMAANLPVTCSNIPTLKEVYQDAALYFDPNDPKDIASKIKKILTDEKIRSDLVKKGKERVKQYSWQKMAKETLKVYESIK